LRHQFDDESTQSVCPKAIWAFTVLRGHPGRYQFGELIHELTGTAIPKKFSVKDCMPLMLLVFILIISYWQ
jgi:hypothetical protein